MKITIITVGKLKEKYWKQAVDEYNKRLGAYTKTELIEVADEKAPDNMSDKDIEIVKEKEADRIMSKIKQDSYVITLEIQGKMLTSEGLSKEIDNLMTRGNSQSITTQQLRPIIQQNDLPTPNDESHPDGTSLSRV